ncbi:hypothetical protein Fmac_028104 [Flemingia macrophylla]|uniref:Cytochrome c-552/DMSO reductase-like haem-binding domain-containing protein n=1 Tax=Flemingia macrophylla TaxID=520843 RepID=A0ABD1LJM0_9FABA
MLRYLLLLLFLLGLVESHEESGHWSCESGSEIRVEAEFKPGVITLDGHADDWKDIDGSYFPLLPALDPDAENEFKGGKMTVKSLHDGRDIFFLLQVDGDYAYTKGESEKCPSVALMFQIGDGASYHNMGGCEEHSTSCTNKTCKGHEVDIMHFSIGSAIPGRLYGGNPLDNRDGNGGDRFGHLVDLYAWNPHCRYLDGTGPSGSVSQANPVASLSSLSRASPIARLPPFSRVSLVASGEPSFIVYLANVPLLSGASVFTSLPPLSRAFCYCRVYDHREELMILVHRMTGRVLGGIAASQFTQVTDSFIDHETSFVEDESPYSENGKKGTYFFEFSRPLRTMDHLQQDVQFTIGGSSKMSVALWYPVDGQPWHGSGHYSVNCDWVPIDISVGSSLSSKALDAATSSSSWNVASAFSVILSVAALCVSVFLSYRVFSPKGVQFTPMESL